MLTASQKKLFDFISARVSETCVSPSYHEMMVFMGLKSKSGIHRLVVSLEDRGYIYRLPSRARAIMPVDLVPDDDSGMRIFAMRIKGIAKRREGGSITHARAIKEIISLCDSRIGACANA